MFDTVRARLPRSVGRFRQDERAIEGLPIRLVIALVVGVASLSVMMNMISGISGLSTTELDVQPEPEVTTPGEQELRLRIVGADGEAVVDATVVVKSGSADLSKVRTARTDRDGEVTLTVAPELGPNQAEGTLVVDVKPPAGSGFVDRRGNTRVLVVRE
ncbi:MAG: carboxypeptidase regulatory-like domain-containing protein [Halolamina sp.]